MALDLRTLLADAYRTAALEGADMVAVARALESIRGVGSADAFAAIDELQRQAGLTDEPGLLPALMELVPAIEAARIAEDVRAIADAARRDEDEGWAELRRRFAHAVAEFKDEIAEGIARDAPVPAAQRPVVERWLEQMGFGRRAQWDRALDLFESLGRDAAVDPVDRARFLCRAMQIHLYYTHDEEAARRALAEARELVPVGTASTAGAEVASAAGQFALEHNERDEALRLFEQGIASDPHFEDAYKWMGDAYLEAPDAGEDALEAAEQCYDRGIANAPGGTLNVTALARLLGRKDRYRARRLRIAELRRHALRVTPKHRHGLYVTFADIELQNDEVDEAQKLVDLALAEDETRSDAWILLARIRQRQADPLAAVRSYGRARSVDPGVFDAWGEVAEAVAAAGTAAGTAATLEAVATHFADAPAPQLALARLRLFREVGEWDEAEAESGRILAGDGDEAGQRRRLALIRNARGNRCYENRDYSEAGLWYARALEETPHDAVLWGNLALALEHQSDGDPVERLARAVDALEHAIAEGAPEPDPEYIERRERLAARHRLAARYGAAVLDTPAAPPPVGLDVGPGLLEHVVAPGTSQLTEECLETLDRVRKRVEAERGVAFPGVNFRDWLSAEPGQYGTVLSGVSVTQGSVPPDRWLLFGAPPPGLAPDLPPAADPLSGEIGYWIPESARDRVAGEPRVWSALEYVIHDLARVFLDNLRTELSPDDVARRLEAAGVTGPVTGDHGLQLRVTQVVRALAAEGAPVTALAAIADLVRGAPGRPVADLVEEARMLPGVRERLRGNDGAHHKVLLGPRLSRVVREGVWREDGEPSLAMEPEDCQAFLSRFRDLPGGLRGTAVVTEDELRPFVRWVLELEFPDLPVLARRELLDEEPRVTIELEPAAAETVP